MSLKEDYETMTELYVEAMKQLYDSRTNEKALKSALKKLAQAAHYDYTALSEECRDELLKLLEDPNV
jgi:hypothetical protein